MQLKKSLQFFHLLGAFLAVGCYSAARSSRKVEPNKAENLIPIAQKISDTAEWCDDMPTYGGPNRTSGRESCNTGDSMLWSGLLYYAWPTPSLGQAIRFSIDPDGKPFRSPEHRKARDNESEFSRDMYLGFLFYCLKSQDFETCNRVHQWTKAEGYKLCGGSVSQCGLLPSMLYATYAVWDKNGWPIAPEFKPSNIEQGADAQATLLEAETAPKGYRLHLVSLKVFLYNQVGRTGDYYLSSQALLKRQPSNLWFQLVGFLTGNTPEGMHATLVGETKHIMQAWVPGSTDKDWIWQGRIEGAQDAMGQDFIFMACLLNGGCNIHR